MDRIRIHLDLNVDAFKIAFLAAIGWDLGKIVCNASERILLKILEPRVAALQRKMYEEKAAKERDKASEEA